MSITTNTSQLPLSAAGQAAHTPVLELQGITKQFPGVRALDDVSLQLYAGEVHMLLGENGAGKSSLIKVLYGAYQADQGQFLFCGKPVQIQSPADAKALGIAVIFQEFSLVPFLSIAQNIYLGREPRGKIPGLIDHARMHKEARAVLASLGLDYDTHALAGGLGVAQQQMVEIAKALSQNARILVMDEPTSAISDRESEALFTVIRQLREKGVAIVYISHRMKEVFELGDRITVLRDGKRVDSLMADQVVPEALIGMMIGRSVDMVFKRTSFPALGEIALKIDDLRTSTGVRGVDLVVRAGEIVGLSGLVGAGRTEVARAVFGADPVASGEITIFGKVIKGGPDAVSAAGVGLIPENRKTEGLALNRSVQDNLLAASLWKLFPRGWYRIKKASARASELSSSLRISPPNPHRHARVLSGGNQQKIVIGKWLSAGCRLFIFDEPTRGIDIGAKTEVFSLIENLVEQGAAVLLISSELAEIVHVCDRAYVMREGKIAGALSRDELSEQNILRLAI